METKTFFNIAREACDFTIFPMSFSEIGVGINRKNAKDFSLYQSYECEE